MNGTVEFDLTDARELPTRPRTVTARLVSPPARPATVPPAEDCTPEELVDLAAAAAQDPDTLWSLIGSSAHVAAICELLAERVAPALRVADKEIDELEIKHAHEIRALQLQLAAAQGVAAAAQRHHEIERVDLIREIEQARDAHQVTALKLEYVKGRLLEEEREALRLRGRHTELSADAVLARRFAAATLAISKKTYLEVQAELAAEERAEQARNRIAEGSDATIVVDVPIEGAAP